MADHPWTNCSDENSMLVIIFDYIVLYEGVAAHHFDAIGVVTDAIINYVGRVGDANLYSWSFVVVDDIVLKNRSGKITNKRNTNLIIIENPTSNHPEHIVLVTKVVNST